MQLTGYDDIASLAIGRTSALYRARSVSDGQSVALKVYRFEVSDERARSRFRRACARACAASVHPHLVRLHEGDVADDGHPYLVTDLIEGASVADELYQGLFTAEEVTAIGATTAATLAAGHEAGLLHQQFGPENLLIPADSGSPVVTELGVGLAEERWEFIRRHGGEVDHHASPEVVESGSAVPASDVFSLASVLYTMLAGDPPYQAEGGPDSPSGFLLRVLQEDLPRLPEGAAPAALEGLLRASLAASPADRPTMADLRDELVARLEPGVRKPATGSVPLVLLPGAGTDSTDPDVEDPFDAVDRPGSARELVLDPAEHRWPDLGVADRHDPVDPPDPDLEEMTEELSGAVLDPLESDEEDGWTHPPADERRRRRRSSLVLGAGVAAMVTILINGLWSANSGSGTESAEGSDGAAATGGEGRVESHDAAQESSDQGHPRDPGPSNTSAEPGGGGGDLPGSVVGEGPVPGPPTGLTAHAGPAGVQLDWSGSGRDHVEGDSYVVLVFLEDREPRIELADGPSFLVPSVGADSGACFAVAHRAHLPDLAATGEDPGQGDVSPAFSPVVCTGGATEESVRAP